METNSQLYKDIELKEIQQSMPPESHLPGLSFLVLYTVRKPRGDFFSTCSV